MKSPTELAKKLARQWENHALREKRLLGAEDPEVWPLRLPIGKPPPAAVKSDTATVQRHFQDWQTVTIGEVDWQEARYQATATPVRYPAFWLLPDVGTWVQACQNRVVTTEFRALASLLAKADSLFHPLLIRRRGLWRDRDPADVKTALRLAFSLTPGCAEGLPLRAFPGVGNDTKFFERNETLLAALLDLRFDGEASELGLAAFLGAADDRDRWLLVADLDGGLLPFPRLRLTPALLAAHGVPGTHLLIVENEQCLHQLPDLPSTLAVLGTGFNLSWLSAPWLQEKSVSYWGDLDTWGLTILAQAKSALPTLTPLLMTREVFEAHLPSTVPEPQPAQSVPPEHLSPEEKSLYHLLLTHPTGRLEQEFLPIQSVHLACKKWHEEHPK